MGMRSRSQAHGGAEALDNRRSGECRRAAGALEHALVLPPSLRFGAACRLTLSMLSNVQQLKRRGATRARRATGRAHGVRIDAGADAVVLAQHVGEGLRGCAQVHHGEAIGLEAGKEVGPACDGRELLARDEAHIPAEGAEGLAVKRVAEFCFRQREHQHQVLVDRGRNLLSAHGLGPVGDHHDHQRPEAQRDADQGRQIADEPQGESPALHGRDYTAASSPADLAPLFPSNFWRK